MLVSFGVSVKKTSKYVMMKNIIFVMYRFFWGNWPTTRSKFYETIHVYVVQKNNLFFIAI